MCKRNDDVTSRLVAAREGSGGREKRKGRGLGSGEVGGRGEVMKPYMGRWERGLKMMVRKNERCRHVRLMAHRTGWHGDCAVPAESPVNVARPVRSPSRTSLLRAPVHPRREDSD